MNKLGGNKNMLTMVACLVCVGLIFFGVDAMAIVLIVGLLDFLLGVNIYRVNGATTRAKMMIATGAYIFVMGVLYLTKVIPENWFWDIFAGGLLIIVVIGFILLRKK